MYTADDLWREAQWERVGVERAAELYRQSAGLRPASTLPSGTWLFRQIIDKLIPEIEKAQQEAVKTLTQVGQPPLWALPMTAVPADKLAVITTTVAFNAVRGADEAKGVALAQYISTSVRDEIEYQRWVTEQQAANKAARKEGDWNHVDLLAKFKRTYPNVLQRVWAKWRQKVDALREERWPVPVAVSFGAELLGILCRVAPEHFTIVLRRAGKQTTAYLELSPATIEMLNDIENRAAFARPQFMPMIIPPIPWAYPDNRKLSTDTTLGSGILGPSCLENIPAA